jgi:hypothetical protein
MTKCSCKLNETDEITFKDSYFYFKKYFTISGFTKLTMDVSDDAREKGFIVNKPWVILYRRGFLFADVGVEIANPQHRKYLIGRSVFNYKNATYHTMKMPFANTKKLLEFFLKIKEIEDIHFLLKKTMTDKDYYYFISICDDCHQSNSDNTMFILPKNTEES